MDRTSPVHRRFLGVYVDILETIAPIFIIIAFGYVLKSRKMLSDAFVSEANRFVFRFPLPFLIFTGILKANMKDVGWLSVLSLIIPTAMVMALAALSAVVARYQGGKRGSFIQTTFHGNVTYVGLAVIFYLLGDEGLERGSLLVGMLILFNNAGAVLALSLSSGKHRNVMKTALSILTTPVIVATFAALILAFLKVTMPAVIMKSITIVANIALPMALIIIGCSISLEMLRKTLQPAALAATLKVIVLPALAVLFCRIFAIDLKEALPAIILLATPTAITAYVMARELGGDTDLASGTVTLTTLVSPLTYLGWIWLLKTA